MMNLPARSRLPLAIAAALGLCGAAAHADPLIINDTLTGNATSAAWDAIGAACLTAGNTQTPAGSVPSCSSLAASGKPYYNKTQVGGVTGTVYPTPDPIGKGALRLTNGDTTQDGSNGDYQTGAVLTHSTYPSNQGVQVTWTSVTYGGDGNSGTGADGMTFFIADGSAGETTGGLGGSVGYSCSNGNSDPSGLTTQGADGVNGAYLGIGIDEYGNFSNPGDATSTPVNGARAANRISLRGSGSTNWAWLNATYPQYYPGGTSLTMAQKIDAVHKACSTGTLWDYSSKPSKPTQLSSKAITYNYNYLTYKDLGTAIANQEATAKPLRSSAVPIVYSLKISPDALLDFSYSINGGTTQTVASGLKITDSNGPLPATFRFGFVAGTGGGSNVHEITCFKAAPANQSTSSAGTDVKEVGRVMSGSQLFLANTHPTNWWGQVTAQSLLYDSTTDALTVATTANWDANCVLTGGTCTSTGGNSVAVEGPTARAILTFDGSTGVPFQWANLTSTQQAALTAGGTSNDTRLKYLRGDRSNEGIGTSNYRVRTGVLGDVIDSGPTWVGPPSTYPNGAFVDKLRAGVSMPEGSSYATFASTYAARLNVVYTGANDGLLHGFRAGSFDSSGNFVTTQNDGREVLAYMPSQALATIHSTTSSLDYSNSQYSHNFFVDAAPGVGDLYYKGAWHTWLVGGLGPGGQAGGPISDPKASAGGALYALDITDPSQFSESNAATLVIGEISSTSFSSCVNVPSTCNNNLGLAFGTPLIRRLHDGNWAVLFGNGLNSASGSAGLFILHVNSSTGTRTLRYIDTGYTAANDPQNGGKRNGIVQVTAADLDGDHVTDYVYAGDVFGNLWRFDLTSSSPSQWSVGSAPMFSAPAGQPITTRVTVTQVPTPGSTRQKLLIAFGTGQKTPQTLTSAESYASGAQALYGVWDWNLAAWNATSTDTKYDVATSAPQTLTVSSLQAQTVTSTLAGTGNVSGYRTVSSNPVCWSGSTACQSNNNKFGWTLALPTATEQVIYNPVATIDSFLVNTIIPATQQILTCSSTPASGYTMAVQIGTGGAAPASMFANDAGSFTDNNISGLAVGGVGTPTVMTAGQKMYIVQQTRAGNGDTKQVNGLAGGKGQRVNWTKIR
jgi:type IV pilus assembly protein PilY1